MRYFCGSCVCLQPGSSSSSFMGFGNKLPVRKRDKALQQLAQGIAIATPADFHPTMIQNMGAWLKEVGQYTMDPYELNETFHTTLAKLPADTTDAVVYATIENTQQQLRAATKKGKTKKGTKKPQTVQEQKEYLQSTPPPRTEETPKESLKETMSFFKARMEREDALETILNGLVES